MAWRIHEQVVRGEIDSRQRGVVTGQVWLAGRDAPLVLQLEGNPWRDLAGHRLTFTNSTPKSDVLKGLALEQTGVVGDITASRKVKVPDCSMEEVMECYKAKRDVPWHWGNTLYLEWFSLRNGRVVIESADFQLEIDENPTWNMTEEEETEQRMANSQAIQGFMDQMVDAAHEKHAEEDDDAPHSAAEAQADEEAARMDLFLDRVTPRLEREGFDEKTFDRIHEEERERLRRERGEAPLTPEQEAERESRIDDLMSAEEEVLAEMEAEKWKGEDTTKERTHPLAERCGILADRLHDEIVYGSWLPQNPQPEHPLLEVLKGTLSASAKLAGALTLHGDETWPPEPEFAGDTLVRLKKARGYLRDALRGLDSADQEQLATPAWRADTRRELLEILTETSKLIVEVRQMLSDGESA